MAAGVTCKLRFICAKGEIDANGGDKNWDRICGAIDGFRVKYDRWPKRVRVPPMALVDLASQVLTPTGFDRVSSFVEIVPEEDAFMIAGDDSGAEYDYSKSGFPERDPGPTTRDWFGEAIV